MKNKPCRCCGGEAVLCALEHKTADGKKFKEYWMECTGCNLSFRQNTRFTKKEARDMWNHDWLSDSAIKKSQYVAIKENTRED